MSFPKQEKHAFTVAKISLMVPKQSGIYGIFNHSQCIYVSKSQDIRQDLLQHINGESEVSAQILEQQPQYWQAVIVGMVQLDFWEKILLRQLRPLYPPHRR